MWRLFTWFRHHLVISLGLFVVLFVLVIGGSFVLVRAQTQDPQAPSCGSLTLHEGGAECVCLESRRPLHRAVFCPGVSAVPGQSARCHLDGRRCRHCQHLYD